MSETAIKFAMNYLFNITFWEFDETKHGIQVQFDVRLKPLDVMIGLGISIDDCTIQCTLGGMVILKEQNGLEPGIKINHMNKNIQDLIMEEGYKPW